MTSNANVKVKRLAMKDGTKGNLCKCSYILEVPKPIKGLGNVRDILTSTCHVNSLHCSIPFEFSIYVLRPWRVFLAAAIFGIWRLGHRSFGMWTMWWMGLSSLYRQVLQDGLGGN